MTRLFVGAGMLAFLLPLASPGAAQEECTCITGDHPLVTFQGPEGFAFLTTNRARIGVGFATSEQEGFFDVGARITEVTDDSPAQEAGLRTGDVVVAVDGHDLMSPLSDRLERRIDEDGSVPVQRLMALAREWEVGEPVDLVVLRDDDEIDITVTPEERDFDMAPLRWQMRDLGESLGQLAPQMERFRDRVGPSGEASTPFAPRSWIRDGEGFEFSFGSIHGLELTEINPRLGSYFGVESGVLVTDVREGTDLGLEPGDVILSIGGRDVDAPRDVRRILGSYDADEEIRFEVRRDGSSHTVTGTVD